MKLLKTFCILIIFVSTTLPQQIGTWRNYTNFRSISDAFITNEGIWASSSGGAFYYNFKDTSYQTLNLSNNGINHLSISKLTSLTVDNEGKVWLGNSDGFLDVYDPAVNSFKRIFGINGTDIQNKQINHLSCSGDTILVSTSFGLVLIDSKNYDFKETPTKFGSFSSNISVNNSFVDRLLYVSTDLGIAIQKEGRTNLTAPDSWDTFTTLKGLPSNTVHKIVKYNDTLIAATNSGFAKFSNNLWQPFLSNFNGTDIIDVTSYGSNTLYILVAGGIYSYANGVLAFISPNNGFSKIFIDKNSNLYAATNNGLLEINNNRILAPDGPVSNSFISMDVDGDGSLWVATGKDNKGVGINKFDGTRWSNFNAAKDHLLTNDFWRMYAAPDNTVYAGSWGSGFARIRDNKITNFSAHNTGLVGIPQDLNFVVIHGINSDSKGNIWVVNFWSDPKQILATLTPDSTWHYYTNPLNSTSMTARELVVDQNDTKWFTVGEGNQEAENSYALYYMNENQSLYSSDVNGWGKVTLSSTTPSIISLAIDRRGSLWVGTSEGIYIIDDVNDPKNSISQFIRPLATHVINTIKVDALDQKWVGTQDGVFLLSPDGSQVLQNYNTKNSPLLSDIVKSIAIDDKHGIVYLGTDFGVSSLSTLSITPKAEFSGLVIYPNPVLIQSGKTPLIKIDGLVRDSEIKILSISGKVIRTIAPGTDNPGGAVGQWDVKDDSGNYVSSGVYLIVAYDKDGNNVSTAKVAVIRK